MYESVAVQSFARISTALFGKYGLLFLCKPSEICFSLQRGTSEIVRREHFCCAEGVVPEDGRSGLLGLLTRFLIPPDCPPSDFCPISTM